MKYFPRPIHITMNYNSPIKYLESTPNMNNSFETLLKSRDLIQTMSYANSGVIRRKFGTNFAHITLHHNDVELN